MNEGLSLRVQWFAVAMLASCSFAASAGATILVDDFESYADEASFDAAWFPSGASQAATVPPSLDTAVFHSGSQSMRIDYNLGNDPFFGQVRHNISPSQDWSNLSEVEFWYLGQDTNSEEILGFRFYTSFGSEIGRVQFPISQTKVTTWTRGVLDLSNFTPGGAVGQENDVAQIRIALTGSDFGSGVIWIDDIQGVPEPTSMALVFLGLSGVLLVSRRRCA
ncbi:carbohydrate binding domain-containing protein [Bythopirellula goksoeyrii]|uniref:PEP-CTERM protein-sorting domain-containing protein n=1 Tax=Bythopirellula goksoeyrii TaxID=1400387 RepID=A0A5B9QAI8_9BACT|nr:carbohydrate binding domain-containing protein [Bythopirellula goksoeyrii]QEG33906.1 hypothetical protein Pr1d_11760 [Bythopirellula goksoeyrii]